MCFFNKVKQRNKKAKEESVVFLFRLFTLLKHQPTKGQQRKKPKAQIK